MLLLSHPCGEGGEGGEGGGGGGEGEGGSGGDGGGEGGEGGDGGGTENMFFMFQTRDVSQLSGPWLKANAPCQGLVASRAHGAVWALRAWRGGGGPRGALYEGLHAHGSMGRLPRVYGARLRCTHSVQGGGRATADMGVQSAGSIRRAAHVKHPAHVRDAGGVPAQWLVEGLRVLPRVASRAACKGAGATADWGAGRGEERT